MRILQVDITVSEIIVVSTIGQQAEMVIECMTRLGTGYFKTGDVTIIDITVAPPEPTQADPHEDQA